MSATRRRKAAALNHGETIVLPEAHTQLLHVVVSMVLGSMQKEVYS